ncbi:hypothetical protein DFR30_1251 [Thiogranum longum]|uniref:Uncharacterized protein n=1 Tax=Thiogranum longum TaxID=1537524 RepID=A0A4R1HLA1_9GAMM|nr:hypothetical protein [Thiogranum longum]TCK17992.1 hypothetical protein DFR30_1251 [Thiogranum longum]
MKITLVGTDRDKLIRMKKRLRCAARGLRIDVIIEEDRDDYRALDLGARNGPIAVARSDDGRLHTLMNGLEQVEVVQQRLVQWFSDERGSKQDG